MITDASPRFPQDVAALRRELAVFMGGEQGFGLYLQAIRMGRQLVCPAFTDPTRSAFALSDSERRRLVDADLWFVDDDLCDLVESAFPTMPAFPPRPPDLPSRSGFVVFSKPIAVLGRDGIGVDLDLVERVLPGSTTDVGFVAGVEQILDSGVRVVAASWGPMDTPGFRDVAARCPAGAVWMTFYAESNLPRLGVSTGLPAIQPDNEVIVAWCPDGLGDDGQQQYVLLLDPGKTTYWAALVFAVFQLAGQKNLGETVTETVARAERRRTEKERLRVAGEVRVVRLRRHLRDARAAAGGGDARAARVFRHRWVVRGHWRNVWYPTIKQHRPRWIAPYLVIPEGLEGAPVLGGDKVTRVGAPERPTP